MIKKLKPLFILLGAMLLSYILWFLGQVQPDPVEESPAPDVIVEILTPKDFQVNIISSGCLLYTSDAADDTPLCRSRWSPYH